ncbi:piggyBac transposable element-derived protein 4-like [Pectinophora gossypiella]|uniref:piggyBac transposable element-derived protein 4-like n=1 Tax=Pectinophora gossypiella TaxID=13191 RepID=UPI00214EF560|nr:piggyBac transposable element-derived protein 4-like [Pectinophora gossypiella]XP_049870082.1 piggyBac transposable element-derived protein 4-like [Pectinophora gossypiella]
MSKNIVPALSVVRAPGGTLSMDEDVGHVLYERMDSGILRIWQPAETPEIASPPDTPYTPDTPEESSTPRARRSASRVVRRPRRCRRALLLRDQNQTAEELTDRDSGSDNEFAEVNNEVSEGDETREPTDFQLLAAARRLRSIIINREELGVIQLDEGETDQDEEVELFEVLGINDISTYSQSFEEGGDVEDDDTWEEEGVVVMGDGDMVKRGNGDGGEKVAVGGGSVTDDAVTPEFSWTDDFSTFSGQEEIYTRNPGPICKLSDPTDIFLQVWDLPIIQHLVAEYNRYGLRYIETRAEDEGGLNKHLLSWELTTVEEMYRCFSVFMFMSLGNFNCLHEYWSTGILGMPEFRRIMPRNRFYFLLRFFHFVDNDTLDSNVRSYDRKIAKIAPIIDHCNAKFPLLYTPQRFISLDESLLLWKGRLSFKQCNRLKSARFGIKSYDLCEAGTGYLLRTHIYAGKDSSMTEGAIDDFENCTAKVVLEAMDGYLDVGHCLVMDNWYNQLPLTRYLKSRRTDVIGTINRRRQHMPPQIKNLDDKRTQRGEQLALHCGDMSVVTWKDVKQVTAISTYHNDDQLRSQRAGVPVMKPKVVVDYNKNMGGVDLKDQKLSAYHFERKRGLKWYMKVFRRLLNTSLLNCYIIYTKQPLCKVLTHRQFRMAVAEGLLNRFPRPLVDHPPARVVMSDVIRLDGNDHYPGYTPEMDNVQNRKHVRRRCVCCTIRRQRSDVTTLCKKCNVALCIVPCFEQYHTQVKL